jgi:hypothetical protein
MNTNLNETEAAIKKKIRDLLEFLPRLHLLKQDVEVIDLVVTSALASKCRNLWFL